MNKTRQWLASVGIAIIVGNHITAADMHGGSHYFWPNYLALALGVALLLKAILVPGQKNH